MSTQEAWTSQCASSLLRDAFSQNARDPLCQLARDGNRVTNSGQTQSRAQRPFPSVQNFLASIFKYIQAKVAPIQFDPRMGNPGSRHACRPKHLPANRLGHVARVLYGIVQVELVQPVE